MRECTGLEVGRGMLNTQLGFDFNVSWVANFPLLQMLNFKVNLRYERLGQKHGLRTPNEGINQRNLKIWA